MRDLEAGVAVEHAAEDEVVEGDGLLERLADGVDHEEGAEAGAVGEAEGVDDEGGGALGQLGPEGIESGGRTAPGR